MRFDIAAVLGLTLAAFTAPAVGLELSSVPENLLSMVGDWRLEQEDQSLPVCPLTFSEDPAEIGWLVFVPELCPAPFPSADAFHAWSVDENSGDVLLMNASGAITLRLIEGEDGLFVTEPGATPAFYLMHPWDLEGFGGEAAD